MIGYLAWDGRFISGEADALAGDWLNVLVADQHEVGGGIPLARSEDLVGKHLTFHHP